ncbi:peroxiredoxin-like family protein [Microscilla marina]|uniref:thioredoxin-dependent peroxiredoxin n=1 Tax=Microscilla marina ATCC 23134 TaxID=313606 RepID=A1ZH57_MICM2|nr:peroxiredoxin-like family protein [Microscilla marina]EAY30326.1 AhpC/Tsa family protein [Microscilla marina ATCC 23134]
MTLQEELDTLKAKAQSANGGETVLGHHDFVQDINNSGKLEQVPQLGDIAPPFMLPDDKGNIVSSNTLLEKGPLIISFFRGDWCVFCSLELRALQRSLAEFKKLGASLIGISPQSVSYSHMVADKRNVQYNVLSDEGNKIADSYGLMFSMPNQMINAFSAFGVDLKAINGSQSSVDVPVPATFVLNAEGRVVYRFVDADYTKRAEPAAIIASLMEINAQAA